MKKIFLFFILLLVGCNKYDINIGKISKELNKIETNNINIEKSIVNIENDILKKELKDISNEMNKYINLKNIENYAIYEGEKTYIFIIKTNIDIKQNINNFFNDLLKNDITADLKEKIINKMEYKYEDYYIYIVSENNKEILDKIIETKHKLFDNTVTLNNNEIINKYGFDLDNSIVVMSTKLDSEYGYIIIKDIDNDTENKLDNYYKNNQNLTKIKNKNITVYSISNNNDLIKETLKNIFNYSN